MIFTETELKGAFVVDLEPIEDERGFFARTWCQQEFEARRLEGRLVQCSMSFNKRKGTLRGMHWQKPPHEEAKLVRCTRGAIHDVIIDLRPGSPTYRHHVGVVLSAANRRALYIPKGFAHGFLTLEEGTEVFYQMSEYFAPKHVGGLRWNDPAFQISWPGEVLVISERDRTYPDFVGT